MKAVYICIFCCWSWVVLGQSSAEDYYNKGVGHFQSGDYTKAIKDYDIAIQIDPKYATAYIGRGAAKYHLGRYADAIKDYDTAIQIDPKYDLAYHNRGNAKYNLGRYADAIKDHDTAIQIDPKYALAYIGRGIAKYNLGQYSNAIKDYDTAIQIDPKYALAYIGRGTAKYNLGRYADAIKDYDTAIQIDPKYDLVYYNRGRAKDNLGRYADAIKDYDTAIQIDPKNATAYNNRGRAKNNLGQYSNAIKDYDTAIQIAPKDAHAYHNRGINFKQLNQCEKAKADYQKAVSLEPNNQKYKTSLSNLNCVPPSSKFKIWAVAIGIEKYEYDSHLTDLDYPTQQAYEFTRTLERQYFTGEQEIPVLINSRANKQAIFETLKATFVDNEAVGINDMIILYYSGHGLQNNYYAGICPYDYFELNDLITDKDLIDIMKQSKAKHKVCIVEACKTKMNAMSPISPRQIEQFNQKRKQLSGAVVYITSTKVHSDSYEYPDIGGVFSYYFLQALKGEDKSVDKNQDQYISSKELFDYLKIKVQARTNQRQIPQINEEGYTADIPLFILDD
ncbi:MAG: tetratricopeptide repeat protein [Aureispira sp.]